MTSHALATLLNAFAEERVRYLIVGGLAKRLHGETNDARDATVWYDIAGDNPGRVYRALQRTGAPLDGVGIMDLGEIDYELRIGEGDDELVLISSLDGVTFADAWPYRLETREGDVRIDVIGKDALRAAEDAERARGT